MARKYAKKRFAKKSVRKFGRRRGRYVAKRRTGGAQRRRLYDNRFPVKNALYQGKPAYTDSFAGGTSAPALRGGALSGEGSLVAMSCDSVRIPQCQRATWVAAREVCDLCYPVVETVGSRSCMEIQ